MARKYSIQTQTGDGVTETILVDRADTLAEAFQKALSLSEPGSSVSAYEDIGEATTPTTNVGDSAMDTAPGGPLYTPTILDISDEDTVLNPQTAGVIERMVNNANTFSVNNFSTVIDPSGTTQNILRSNFLENLQNNPANAVNAIREYTEQNESILVDDVVNTYKDELTSRLEQAGANQAQINTQLGLFDNFTAKIETYRNQPETLTRFLETASKAREINNYISANEMGGNPFSRSKIRISSGIDTNEAETLKFLENMREAGDDATPNFRNIGATDADSMTEGGATQFDPTEFTQTVTPGNVTPFANGDDNGANGSNGGNGDDDDKKDIENKVKTALGTEILDTELTDFIEENKDRLIDEDGELSPLGFILIDAFSRDIASRREAALAPFGVSSPFAAISAFGPDSPEAQEAARLALATGTTSPYGALLARSGVQPTTAEIDQILRGGLTVTQQRELEESLARGGLTAQERLAEQRAQQLPSLFQSLTPQTLGALSRVLGSEQAVREAISPFITQSAMQQQQTPMQPTPTQPYQEEMFPETTRVNLALGDPLNQTGPFTRRVAETPARQPRATVGQYLTANPFDRGAIETEAALAGEDLQPFLQAATPFGATTARGGLSPFTRRRSTL